MATLGLIIYAALWLYMALLFIRMILSWVDVLSPRWKPKGPVLIVAETVYTLTDPPLRWLGRFIRPVRMGSVGFDVSYLVLVFAVWLLMRLTATFLLVA